MIMIMTLIMIMIMTLIMIMIKTMDRVNRQTDKGRGEEMNRKIKR